jgi:hypothetical protein
MWCIPKITPEFIERMEEVLELYAKPYDPKEPLLCFDEKSKQLLEETRAPRNTEEGRPRRRDYEYRRNGTRNIFVTVEPKGGYRDVSVTGHRKKPDFAHEIERVAGLPRYRKATKIHIVLDNLNTHFEKSLLETFGKEKAVRLLARIRFHYTPKHASWLNMAEIEIGVLSRQCIRGRVPTGEKLAAKIAAWQAERNEKKAMIEWRFTVDAAREKFKYGGSEPKQLC